ncbi:hypothetical protein [Halolamina salifodinae]|uniref:Uncharacterized protein n=1 Tax=Halolamina salifodinae TaxID=1202767 RepID=A0A8T4GTD1_9EURY|nr:hypothetical protein [Halolamina salifodinae]MBP1986116.1 hypothetical protein [Halolamina salifodinae]
MVDPILTYIGGIAFLALIIVPVLYLMANTPDYEDDSPGETVVGGVGPVASGEAEGEDADEEATEEATEADESEEEAVEDET